MGDRLAGKVTIVTGAGSGIGRASAIRFAEEGARVTCVDINRDAVEETAREIGEAAFAVGAIVMLSKGIALDYAKQGIRCNALAPGWVDTPINYAHAEMLGGLQEVYATIDSFQPIGRPGTPRELANVALFLASDESSFVTGSVIVADGAMTAK